LNVPKRKQGNERMQYTVKKTGIQVTSGGWMNEAASGRREGGENESLTKVVDT
jgi:hypothetical protein